MHCIDWQRRRTPGRLLARAARAFGPLLAAGLMAGCNHPATPQPPAAAPGGPLPMARNAATGNPTATATPPLAGSPYQAAAANAPPRRPPRPARHWDDYRLMAAERIVDANPAGSYRGPVPEPLLAIPVLEVELHADGSVRRIQVMRKPSQALDTVQLAIDAVQRAAPFGAVGHLPRPWKFTEVFLFDEQRRFKPRSLDL